MKSFFSILLLSIAMHTDSFLLIGFYLLIVLAINSKEIYLTFKTETND